MINPTTWLKATIAWAWIADITADNRKIYFSRRKLLGGLYRGARINNIQSHRRIN